jgi:hypothetical protein
MAVFGSRSTFRDVRAWVSRLAVLDRQICRIERMDGQPLGTGFLVAPDLLLTAQHVIAWDAAGPRREFRARFDFAMSPSTGSVLEGVPFDPAPEHWLLAHSPPPGGPDAEAIDTALVRLGEPVGLSTGEGRPVRGWVDLNDAVDEPVEGSSLAIMQHPEGGPLKLSVNTQAVLGLDAGTGRLRYRTDTLPGSSGAPCFDIDWKFVALHEGRDVRSGNYNFGIPFAMIRRWLQERDLWSLVKQPSPATAALAPTEADSASPAETQFAMSPQLRALVAQGEGQLVEFKRGIVAAGADKRVEVKKVLASVAAFMNSRDGGNVMIGIGDDGGIVGIQGEYAAVDPQGANWDGYGRFLNNVLADRLDVPTPYNFFTVTRYHERDREVCAIHVRPADRPVFVDDQLLVRVGAQNRPIKGRDVLSFAAERWRVLFDQPKPKEGPQVELEVGTGRRP